MKTFELTLISNDITARDGNNFPLCRHKFLNVFPFVNGDFNLNVSITRQKKKGEKQIVFSPTGYLGYPSIPYVEINGEQIQILTGMKNKIQQAFDLKVETEPVTFFVHCVNV